MLCEVCSAAIRIAEEVGLQDNRTQFDVSGNHHTTWQSIQTAVELGCYLCCRLRWHIPKNVWSDWRQKVGDGIQHPIKWQILASTSSYKPESRMKRPVVRALVRLKPGFEEFGLVAMPVGESGGEIQVNINASSNESFDDMILTTAEASKVISTGQTLGQAVEWLQCCEKDHSTCRTLFARHSRYPPLLMDITPSSREADTWRLVETNLESVQGQYMTLSHRWGNGDITKLTNESESVMKKGMAIATLCPIYQDAIRVVKRLNVRYLWIDSICIMQDDLLNIKDAASQMDEVYSNAVCNISILTGSNASIFFDRPQALIDPKSLYVAAAQHGLRASYLIEDNNVCIDLLRHQPLLDRGWIFQEQALARCTLYFSGVQILWICPTGVACELQPHIVPLNESLLKRSDLGGLTRINRVLLETAHQRKRSAIPTVQIASLNEMDMYDLWQDVVARYGHRDLTFFDDKLLAVAGIARVFAQASQQEYFAGVWNNLVPLYLPWLTKSSSCRPALTYRAPSWSWASIDGPTYLARPLSKTAIISRALEIYVKRDDLLPFGSVMDGHLLLEAPGIDIDLVSMQSTIPGLLSLSRQRAEYPVALDNRDFLYQLKGPGVAVFVTVRPGDFIDIQDSFLEFFGLLLQPHPIETVGREVFQRVGYFRHTHRVKLGQDSYYTRIWELVEPIEGQWSRLRFDSASMVRKFFIK